MSDYLYLKSQKESSVFLKRIVKGIWENSLLLINKLSPRLATQLLYYKVTGKRLNLKQPVDFNAKLQWLKLNDTNPLIVKCADKYGMHEYVKAQGCEEILNRLLGVYSAPEDIKWEQLPDKVAIKCTHGCGYNIVTKNKNELDIVQVNNKLKIWLNEDFGPKNLEPHYSKVLPKIIAEEYIENKQGNLPLDYKIYCFNGVAKLVLVCSERDEDLRLDFFDLNWVRLDIGHKHNESEHDIEEPTCFKQMVKYAEQLSKAFVFVRIDFYDKDGVPILGEFTFTPAAGMADYYNEVGLNLLGSYLTLPKK